jgi:hypothetical protein
MSFPDIVHTGEHRIVGAAVIDSILLPVHSEVVLPQLGYGWLPSRAAKSRPRPAGLRLSQRLNLIWKLGFGKAIYLALRLGWPAMSVLA